MIQIYDRFFFNIKRNFQIYWLKKKKAEKNQCIEFLFPKILYIFHPLNYLEKEHLLQRCRPVAIQFIVEAHKNHGFFSWLLTPGWDFFFIMSQWT